MLRTVFNIWLILISFSVFAKDFKIENDQVFKTFINEFEKPGTNLTLYQESANYRLDLTLIDLVDKATLVMNDLKFKQHQDKLNQFADNNPVFFYDWFQKLKEVANNDDEFFEALDNKLHLQFYNKEGLALLPEYKYIDLKKLKELGLLRRINRYNAFLNDPEGYGLRLVFEKMEHRPFFTKHLTVEKLREVSDKTLKKIKKAYYITYQELIERQFRFENNQPERFVPTTFRRKKIGLKAIAGGVEKEETKDLFSYYTNGTKIFNIINQLPHKQKLISYIVANLAEDGLNVPNVQGHYILTPIFIEKNWAHLKPILQEFTLLQSINLDDDEYLFQVRKWVKNNFAIIQEQIAQYNSTNRTTLEFTSIPNKKPRRLDVLKQYETLEIVFPDRPWITAKTADLIDRKGRQKYFDESFSRSIGRKFKAFFKHLSKTETYTSIIAGTLVFASTSGNFALSLSSKSLVKKAVYNLKHDKEWKDFLEEAPMDIISAFLLGTGFTAGRLYKILALGAGQGALQSLMTGQDIKTGALVGTAFSLLNYYVLPYSLSKPMVRGTDADSLRTNRLLELTATTIKNSMQGSLVAVLTGEDPFKGAIKGATYGVISTSLAIWFLGTRYYAFKDYTEEDIDDMIRAENAFQNDVGRGGEYAIDRQLILDTNFRVGGALPKIINASITLPGNVSMTDQGFNRLTTLTHESHHLMQQHQSGVFGFYLFRYLPTSIFTGYNGHPDENFLRNVLGQYT